MQLRLFVAVALVSFSFAGPAAAQLGPAGSDAGRSGTGRLSLGVQLSGSALAAGDAAPDQETARGGLGLTVGYGISERVTAFVRGTSAYQTTQLDLGVRYRFGTASRAPRLYVEGAVTGLSATGRPRLDPAGEPLPGTRYSGTGLTVGAGLEVALGRRLGMDLGATHTLGRFARPMISDVDDRSFSSTRVHVGLTWRP